ncbi:MAG: iron-sulfur cluster assembly accessory protein [Candidatus Omnitrophica bacterium]|nr:iron-sulfur cluster assembly accessory protein [Candidatus Omnitrophota bacterium]
MTINLTPEAAEEVSRMIQKEKREGIGLRLGVKGGGCSGLFYAMDFGAPKEGDQVFEFGTLKVFVDPKSYLYLQGTTLDYVDTLQDKGFKFRNPQANKTCGCGESFSV